MLLAIDTTSAMPVYAQIIDQIKRAIATGVLKPGDSLPSLRETAVRLRVNMRTVSAAYKQLEIEGVVETRQGAGSFVAANVEAVSDEYGRETLIHALDAVLMDAYRMGVPFDEIRKLVEERIANAEKSFGDEHPTSNPPAPTLRRAGTQLPTSNGITHKDRQDEQDGNGEITSTISDPTLTIDHRPSTIQKGDPDEPKA